MNLVLRSKFLSLAFVLLMSACGHEQVRPSPDPDPTTTRTAPVGQSKRLTAGEQAATAAVRQIGVPYRYGGTTVRGFDCSGLAQYAYAQVGMRIPRTTAQQWRQLSPVPKDNLQVGDLLFFKIDGSISHVGIFLGKNRFVHAPSSGREVSIAELNSDFYKRAFMRGGRPE
jgi:cell wall-associated NlpC family hydrolase